MTDLLVGELEIRGRIMPASNQTFLAELDGVPVVYKPVSGERPLWDFPDGTLAEREYAAYVVSERADWHVVPPTVLREGPLGRGMVQLWCEPVEDAHPLDLLPTGTPPQGWLHVLEAFDEGERPVMLVHRDDAALRELALFDVVTNNTDRKGGHILPMADGRMLGVDHGICFHVEDKLRTVLWGWGGARLTEAEVERLTALRESLDGALREELEDLLAVAEIDAIVRRVERLLRAGRLPEPGPGWPAIPWPPF